MGKPLLKTNTLVENINVHTATVWIQWDFLPFGIMMAIFVMVQKNIIYNTQIIVYLVAIIVAIVFKFIVLNGKIKINNFAKPLDKQVVL